jgi:hypothetical protein
LRLATPDGHLHGIPGTVDEDELAFGDLRCQLWDI